MGENNNKNNVKVEWDLSQIYSNIDDLKKDIEKELSLTEKMTTFKGKLNNKKDIFEFFKIDEEAELIASKTTAYMALRLQKNMKDLEILKLFGIKPDSVKYNNNSTTGEFTYTTNISGDINDISLLKRKYGSIIFDVKEGDIENHLVVEPNGDMYLDGRKLEISDVSSENFNDITPKRASSWSSRPPAGVKSWSYHRTVSRKKVYLNTKAGKVTAAVIGIILTGAGWVGYVYKAASFAHLTGGYSSCLSFKSVRYVGNPRYLRAYRLDQTLYTEANFKGKSTFCRTYGYNIPNV